MRPCAEQETFNLLRSPALGRAMYAKASTLALSSVSSVIYLSRVKFSGTCDFNQLLLTCVKVFSL